MRGRLITRLLGLGLGVRAGGFALGPPADFPYGVEKPAPLAPRRPASVLGRSRWPETGGGDGSPFEGPGHAGFVPDLLKAPRETT